MSKADTLLKEATAYEILSLYGNRRDYLTAMAQANFPDVNAMVASLDSLRKNIVSSVNALWRQNPGDFPMAAREAYNALAYPADDLTSAAGEQLDTVVTQMLTNMTALYRSLAQSNDPATQSLAQKTLVPAINSAQQKFQQLKETLSMTANLLPSQEDKPAATTPASRQPTATHTSTVSPAATKALQIFLNKAFGKDIIAGRLGPIGEDSIFGQETSGRLQQWAQRNNMPANNVQVLVDTALQQSKLV